MYKCVLNSIVKISLMFAQYFEYYGIILMGTVFLWTHCISMPDVFSPWCGASSEKCFLLWHHASDSVFCLDLSARYKFVLIIESDNMDIFLNQLI